ncbi:MULTISPECIES: hypothetical protein [unclassified Synechocystis]|uniref:hypothetical protein n=1 Tax=unclassified Synechocystis TaxID=2640012 RepID=UPI000422B154|nr:MULTISPECIES: hypothetical protein [unclassified Synechocystis]AIE74547.1 hypothetical protein D082_20190 [Synechocystis sp. PCC 6714]MCT0254088.1 hypothetical protein [Synechocystis sp. CS-94]
MDNHNLSEQEENSEINDVNDNIKHKQNNRKNRRSKKHSLESQIAYFQKSRQIEEKNESNKTLNFSQFIFLFLTITPLFFSLAIFLSKTVFKEQTQQITTSEESKILIENDQILVEGIDLEPKLPPIPNNLSSNSLANQGISNNLENQENNQYIDNQFQQNKNQELEKIIDQILALCKNSGLSTQNLSITLLDVNTREIAGYQSEKLRYPASVVKIFWLVAALNKLPQANNQASLIINIEKMIRESDNDSSGYVVDWLTNTTSGQSLDNTEFGKWAEKRRSLNTFFLHIMEI